MKNIPFNKNLHTVPYSSGISNRQIRRGNERLADVGGQIVRQRRVKSAKRKYDWQ